MRISVTHSTVYRYSGAVSLDPHLLRLRPRQDGAQRLLRFELQITPAPAGQSDCLDQDGNAAVQVWFHHPAESLTVRSSFEVETLRQNPFDFVLTAPPSLPLAYGNPLSAALAPYLAPGPLPPHVHAFAAHLAQQAGGLPMPFLAELNRHLFEDFRHIVRDDGPPYPPEFTLASREGSCRDLAALFCAACRASGIAARFVSGYEREAAIQERAYMHAWAEVFVPGGGWRGYDPTQGLAVAQSHVAVAAAADSLLAAPITGSYRGPASAHMDFNIEVLEGE